MIEAKVICASVSPHYDKPLVTFKLRYPKFIHGEFMTHRVFSRNASSSRAVPVSKNIEEVRSEDRAAPVFWGAEQKGMSPGAELSDIITVDLGNCSAKEVAQYHWQCAAENAADQAEALMEIGAHKSIVNRVLEPYLHINVVCTATEYDNFFGLRLDKAADPTMRALAEAMWREYNECTPNLLRPDEWHLPFVNEEDIAACGELGIKLSETLDTANPVQTAHEQRWLLMIKVSVARCARVSYESFETGKRSTVEEDLRLYDRLVGAQPLHASPAEHQATPDEPERHAVRDDKGYYCPDGSEPWQHRDQHGNFIAWRQYRKMLPGEACAPLPAEYRT